MEIWRAAFQVEQMHCLFRAGRYFANHNPWPSWLDVGVLDIQKNLPCDIDIKPSVARGYWILTRVVPEDIRY